MMQSDLVRCFAITDAFFFAEWRTGEIDGERNLNTATLQIS